MKYAICNEMYEGWSLDRVCEHAKRFGYDGLEIAPFTLAEHVDDIKPSNVEGFRREAEQNELQIVGLHWLFAKTEGLHLTSADADVRKATANHLEKLGRLCHDLGGKVMIFGSPAQRNFPDSMEYQEAQENASRVLEKIIPALEKMNVILALEPLGPQETNFVLTAESAVEIIEHFDSSSLRLILDVKAMSTESKAIPEIVEDCREWTVHFHANDPNRLGPGMGNVDYAPIFEALQKSKFDGWVSVEPFDYSPGVDQLAKASIEYMKNVEAQLNR